MQKMDYCFRVIARIRTDFQEKFGIPRQSGLVQEVTGTIVFEKEFRDENALLGIEEFSHLWLLWIFSENERSGFSPTVRPPRLGGNEKRGVFATRSSFRPNPIALSAVKLLGVERTKEHGTALKVSGVDMMDGTPIVDIKPYLPYADSLPFAKGGFADKVKDYSLVVEFPDPLKSKFSLEQQTALEKILSQDPRPSYHNDERVYGMRFADKNVKFTIKNNVLYVLSVEKVNL